MKDDSQSLAAEAFGRNLRKLRKDRKMTQEKLAEELGVCTKHISELETGKTFISGALMDEIARYFDTSFDELFLTEERRMERDGEAARIASSMLRRTLFFSGFCVLVFIFSIEPQRAGTRVTATKRELKSEMHTVMTRSWNMTPIIPMSYL